MKKTIGVVAVALAFFAWGAFAALTPAKAQVACLPVQVLMSDSDVVAEEKRFPIIVPMQLVHLQGCTSSTSVAEAKASYDAQVRSGSVLAFGGEAGQNVFIPPSKIVRSIPGN